MELKSTILEKANETRKIGLLLISEWSPPQNPGVPVSQLLGKRANSYVSPLPVRAIKLFQS